MRASDLQLNELALRKLACGYAFGLDNVDPMRFADVFLPDGKLTIIFARSELPPSQMIGRDVLLQTPGKLSGYDKTMHFLGQSEYGIEDGSAIGLVYCLAHHVSVSQHGGIDHVMHMSYDDKYACDEQGNWKIAERTGVIHWTETRSIDLPGF